MVLGEVLKWRPGRKDAPAPGAKEILPDSAVGPGVLAPEETAKPAKAESDGKDELSLAEIQRRSQELQHEANDLFSALQKKYGRSKWDKDDALYQQWHLATAQVRQWEELREMKENYENEERIFVKSFSRAPISEDEQYLEAREDVKDNWLEKLTGKKEMNAEREKFLREVIADTQRERRSLDLWMRLEPLLKGYQGARGSEMKESAKDGIVVFLNKLNEKDFWGLAQKAAQGEAEAFATFLKIAYQETGLIGSPAKPKSHFQEQGPDFRLKGVAE